MSSVKENEYFEKLDKLIQKRNNKLYSHYGKCFLESYTNVEEREWYEENITSIDKEIIKCAKEIVKILKINCTIKKIADVFKNEKLTEWYNKKKIEKNKKLGDGKQ